MMSTEARVWGAAERDVVRERELQNVGVSLHYGVKDASIGEEQDSKAHRVLGVGVAPVREPLDVPLDVADERRTRILAVVVGVGLLHAAEILQRELAVKMQLKAVRHRERERSGSAAAVGHLALPDVVQLMLETRIAQHILSQRPRPSRLAASGWQGPGATPLSARA